MEKIVEQGLLYDFYGELLTEHQKDIYECLVNDNMSLGEIAEEKGISRQAVFDIIKRCDKILLSYEDKLGLIARFDRVREGLDRINAAAALLDAYDDKKVQIIRQDILSISEKISGDL